MLRLIGVFLEVMRALYPILASSRQENVFYGGGRAVARLTPWPERCLSLPLLRKGVGVWAKQRGGNVRGRVRR